MRHVAVSFALLLVAAFAPLAASQAPAVCADPAGHYATNFEDMHLNASGATGYYEYDQGRLEGSYDAATRTLTGRWAEAPTYAGPGDAGNFTLVFTDGCASFSGPWRHDGDAPGGAAGTWVGTRISPPPTTSTQAPATSTPAAPSPTAPAASPTTSTPTQTPPAGPTPEDPSDAVDDGSAAPAACDMSGDWSTSLGDLALLQDGNHVRSRNASDHQFVGEFHGRNVTGTFTGAATAKSAVHTPVKMTMAADCDSFKGTYETFGDSPGAWSGHRRGGDLGIPDLFAPIVVAVLLGVALMTGRRRR